VTPRYGIDTSVLVRLLTGAPKTGYESCVEALTGLVEQGAEVFASNQVIGEAYITVQHHYGVSKDEAREGLVIVLTSGLVAPLNGMSVLEALRSRGGCGLVDRLIADDYRRGGFVTLTIDRKMAPT
jgi:predicted nucleic acid-binding protein